jgi:Ca2+-binding RTX toxin-like protein
MAYWNGTSADEYKDFYQYGDQADEADGWGGQDTIWGWKGDDKLWGGDGNDYVYGEDGADHLYGGNDADHLYGGDGWDVIYGGKGVDTIYGEGGNDSIYGGPDPDKLYGGSGNDSFIYYVGDTGDYVYSKHDTIYDFNDGDVIWLKGSYSYGGDTHYPTENQYSIFQKNGNTYVSYNSTEDSGYHDILVKGADPHGDIQFW